MSEPTYFETLGDLVHDVLVRCGEGLDGTTDTDYELHDAVVGWINRVYRQICQARTDWKWLRRAGTLVLQPAITDGTINVTKNNDAVTFSQTPGDSVLGWYLRTNNCGDIFRITDHEDDDTEATLDAVFTGTTDTTSDYTLFKLEYELAGDFVRMIDPMTTTRSGRDSVRWGEITGCSPADMMRDYPLAFIQAGIPTRFCELSETSIRFDTYPEDLLKIDYQYNFRPADLTDDSDEPVIPVEKRILLSDFATAMLLRDKDHSRADSELQLANMNIEYFLKEYDFEQSRQNPNFMKIFPHPTGTGHYPFRKWRW